MAHAITHTSNTERVEPGICPEAETSIVARFSRMVERCASRTALVGSACEFTYGELDLASNRLANLIIASGLAPGGRVALLMRHDAPLIFSALAALKAAGVVVVLNPSDPPERLRQILEDAGAAVIVTDSMNHDLAGKIASKFPIILRFEQHESAPSGRPGVRIGPHDLAWLLYTSGSTGHPKGVMQTHRNLVHNMLRLARGMELRPEDRLVLLASPSGGQGVATTLCALLNGAALVPFAIAEKGSAGLKDCLRKQKISVCVSSPSIFRHFVNNMTTGDFFPEVRLVRFGSEATAAGDLAACRKYFRPGCVFLNSLSASETGNIALHRFGAVETFTAGKQPVGPPAQNIEILLRDEKGADVADGQDGEIVVRGRYLSPGYWRNEALTAARFSGDADGFRTYHTGDLARRLPDGSLVFVGRKDGRVKIRGYRVEIPEIEEALMRLPEVQGACASARTGTDGDVELIAHVILRKGRNGEVEALQRALRRTLPGYMVPAHFVFLEKFPLTPHGKIDRQALPAPGARKKTMRRSERPRDTVEKRLARIWEDVLGISPIGVRDDFFDLGGTSLQSAEVLRRIEETLGASLSPSTLTEYSTLQQLAGLLIDHAVIPSASPLVTLRASGSGLPLFFIHSGQGDLSSYGLLVRRLPDRPIYGLQSIGLQGEAWPLMSVEAMARRYIPEIIAKNPAGPYLLAATCMGGLVAFEIARLLAEDGRKVALTALFDTHYPVPAWRQKILLKRFYGPWLEPARDGLRMLWWLGVRSIGRGRSARGMREYRRFVAHMNRFATRNFRPGFYPGELTLFHTSENVYPRGDGRMLMKNHAKSVRVIALPGKRVGLFVKPTVDELGRQLQERLEEADAAVVRGTAPMAAVA